jgi:predicted MFS family arabinose efflux permease
LLLGLASFATDSTHFVGLWALGSAAIGGGLYYSVTMPITTRLYPENRASAFSVLTFLGALASPIFYPLAGWLSEALGWRASMQVLVLLMALLVAPAALFVQAPAAARDNSEPRARGDLRRALAEPAVHRALLVLALASLANAGLLLHQVAAMQAAGLSLAAAAGFAGARGAFQIPGRLVLTPLTARFGVKGSIGVCYALAVTATVSLLLAVSGNGATVFVVYFTVVSGVSLGLLSPLNGLFQSQVYRDEWLGTLSGVTVLVTSASGALGAALAGEMVDATGSYQWTLLLIVLLQALALAALVWQASAGRSREQTGATASGAEQLR